MSLSEDEEREILLRVKELIRGKFQEDFQEVYSYAITTLEKAPEQANNEIRNALNHIARALSAEDIEAATHNVKLADGHIERAMRDCIKLALIHLHEQIQSDLVSIEIIEGAVPLSQKRKVVALQKEAFAARQAETNGDPDVLEKMAISFANYKTFQEDLHSQFAIPSGMTTKLRRFVIKLRHQSAALIAALIIGVVSGIGATWIWVDIFHRAT